MGNLYVKSSKIKKIVWGIFILSFAGNFIAILQEIVPSFYLSDKILERYYIISIICIVLLILVMIYNALVVRKILTIRFIIVFLLSIILQFALFFLFMVLRSE